eukprot:GEMP01064056.1.p1 GENE.GEMP01064056.1~~GEMP01064056.1.p1  ORF type:complete len:136 (+),score=19.55 GEMP01064056.1:165-572(+)
MCTRFAPYLSKFWQWTCREVPAHQRWTVPWWKDAALKCTVFAITGTSSMYFVRPALARTGIEGSWREGPNSYRAASLLVMSPIYTCILLSVGTAAGQHRFFAKVAARMWSRLLPKRVVERYVLCAQSVRGSAKAL